jgi:hypothetical protein
MADPYPAPPQRARIQWVILFIAAACLMMEVIRVTAEVLALAQLRKDHESAYSRLESRIEAVEDGGTTGTSGSGNGSSGSAMQVAQNAQSAAEAADAKAERAIDDLKDLKEGKSFLTVKDGNTRGHIDQGFFQGGGSYLRLYDSNGNLRAELGESSEGNYCIWLFKPVSANPGSQDAWNTCNPH